MTAAAAKFTITATIGGAQVYQAFERTSDHPNCYVGVPLPAGKTVTDWVKVDANTAGCNLPGSHGYSNGNFDVYWVDTNGDYQVRHGVPGTIVTNALTLDGGAGTDFPANGTTGIVVTPQVEITVQCDGDEAVAFAVEVKFTSTSETAYSSVVLRDDADAVVKALHLPPNEGNVWWINSIHANPLTGNVIESCVASCGSATNAATLNILILEDAT